MSQFEDIEFDKCPEFVHGDNGERMGATYRAYGDVVQTIPESEWQGLVEQMDEDGGGLERLIVEIKDQKQEGSCTAQAITQAMQILQARQVGKDNVRKLSAMGLYKRIARSAQSGSVISDGIDEAVSRGMVPLDCPENRAIYGDVVMANVGFSKPMPEGWEEVARQFKADEWLSVKGVEQVVTAAIKGHPQVVGRDGHAICYIRPQYRRGVLGFIYPNSWSLKWGEPLAGFEGGFGWDSLSKVKSAARWAFALRSIVTRE